VMSGTIAALAVLATALSPVSELVPSGVGLSYQRPLGQVAEYRLLLEVRGEQISLGERRPVRVSAELAFTEEVVAQERDGVMWLRVGARPVEARDASGTFAARGREHWPHVQVRMTPRGEVLDVSLATGEHWAGVAERSFVSLMAQPAPVVLRPGRTAVGDEWEWESAGASQRSRLVEVRGEGAGQVARIVSESRAPLELTEGSEALGLATRVSGDVAQQSEVDLLVARGLVARHKGEMEVHTKSEVTLALPEGPRVFDMRSDLQIEFDLKLVRVDGEAVNLR